MGGNELAENKTTPFGRNARNGVERWGRQQTHPER